MKRKNKVIVLALSTLLLGGEIYARWVLGLGDPALSVGLPDVDYMFRPDQRCLRFGNRIWYNNYSMRCDTDISLDYSGRRLIVVGDSVVNGGALTDQGQLATARLQSLLPNWQVCNISAGSWGPGNYLAYFRRYPEIVRTNDVLVVQLSSHDLWEDDPSVGGGKIVGRDRSFPSRRPICALWEGWTRYAWPRLCKRFGFVVNGKGEEGVGDALGKVREQHSVDDSNNASATYNIACCEALFEMPFAEKYMFVHRTRPEMQTETVPVGEGAFVECAKRNGIPVVRSQATSDDYRDFIHLNVSGQRKMADAIYQALVQHGVVR